MLEAPAAPLTVDRSSLLASLQRAIDRPATEALLLARRAPLHTAALALLGLFLISASTAASAALGESARGGHDALRAALEAVAVVVPGAAIFATYLRLQIRTRALLAAHAVGLLVAGVVAISLLPLVLFLALVARDAAVVPWVFELLIPGVALATAAAIPARVTATLDGSWRAALLARGTSFALLAVFALRLFPQLSSLLTR